jgi:hypothetical protein
LRMSEAEIALVSAFAAVRVASISCSPGPASPASPASLAAWHLAGLHLSGLSLALRVIVRNESIEHPALHIILFSDPHQSKFPGKPILHSISQNDSTAAILSLSCAFTHQPRRFDDAIPILQIKMIPRIAQLFRTHHSHTNTRALPNINISMLRRRR